MFRRDAACIGRVYGCPGINRLEGRKKKKIILWTVTLIILLLLGLTHRGFSQDSPELKDLKIAAVKPLSQLEQLQVQVQSLKIENAQLRFELARLQASSLILDLYKSHGLDPNEFDFDASTMTFNKRVLLEDKTSGNKNIGTNSK